MDIVFIGNFVNDLIVKCNVDGTQSVNSATGGSVTYGSLATAAFGSHPRIITKVGEDLPAAFLQRLDEMHIGYRQGKHGSKNPSYKLYYDEKNQRTLTLAQKGLSIGTEEVMESVGRPDALLFVPIAAEFDERLVLDVMERLKKKNEGEKGEEGEEGEEGRCPVVGLDVQGFVRCFGEDGHVSTRATEEMVRKFKALAPVNALGVTTIFKAEYAEAIAMVGPLEPKECAKRLRDEFGFTIVSVTMGPLGGYLSSSITGEIYIPTFKPRAVLDETGCGDTFLACTVAEILHIQRENQLHHVHHPNRIGISAEQVYHSFLVGSAAASFLVECVGPHGFATREQILERIRVGVQTKETDAQVKYSLTVYNNKAKD